MAVTSITDLQVVPSKFTEYIIEETTKKSALVRSGVAVDVPQVRELINGMPRGGNMVTIPFYKPLSGADEVFGEGAMTPDKVSTDADVATLLIRQKAWGDTDLARVLGGTDPLAAIGSMVSDYWVEREQVVLINVLDGLFTGEGAALEDHVLDISEEEGTDAIISVDATLDAKQLMGDAAEKLGIIVMHSATFTRLQKNQNIDVVYDSDLKIQINKYLGYDVIVDDDCPVADGVYTTYILGKGAFARCEGMPAGLIGVETDRNKLSSISYLINRRAFTMHPIGVAFNANATFTGGAKYATNTDLADPDNWSLVKNHKNVPIVALKHRLTVAPASAGTG